MNPLALITCSLIIGISMVLSAMIIVSPQKHAIESLQNAQVQHKQTTENWKKRWDADTKEITKDLEATRKEIFDQSIRASTAEVVASQLEKKLKDLQKENAELLKQTEKK